MRPAISIIAILSLLLTGCIGPQCSGEYLLFEKQVADSLDKALAVLDAEDTTLHSELWPESTTEEVVYRTGRREQKEVFMIVDYVQLENGSLQQYGFGGRFLDADGNLYLRWTC